MNAFHGWRIVAAGALLQFMQAGLLTQAFGAYVAQLSSERGWSKTSLSGGAALQSIEGALLGPILGWLMDRFGARTLVRMGLIILGLGFVLLGRVQTLAGFYVAIVMVAVGASFSGYFPLQVTVVHWFHRKRARALSTVTLGQALGGLAVPLVVAMMSAWGWRTTAFASGMLVMAVGLPLTFILHRRPEDFGQHPDGIAPQTQPDMPSHARPATASATPRFSASQALRTRAFWLLGVGHALALLVVSAVNVHALSHMKEGLGYTLQQASLVITLMTLSQVGGVLAGAAVGDRFEKRHVAATCMLGHMAGLLMLAHANHPAWLVGFAVLHGVSWGLRGPMMSALRADYFGLQAIGAIMGLSALIIAIGQVAGPLLAGGLADLTGSYRLGLTVIALIAGCGSAVFVLARKPAEAGPRPAGVAVAR